MVIVHSRAQHKGNSQWKCISRQAIKKYWTTESFGNNFVRLLFLECSEACAEKNSADSCDPMGDSKDFFKRQENSKFFCFVFQHTSAYGKILSLLYFPIGVFCLAVFLSSWEGAFRGKNSLVSSSSIIGGNLAMSQRFLQNLSIVVYIWVQNDYRLCNNCTDCWFVSCRAGTADYS